MGTKPPNEPASFSIKDLKREVDSYLTAIPEFIRDMGSGIPVWLEVQKELKMLKLQAASMDENIKIHDKSLVEQYKKISFQELPKMDVHKFRLKVLEAVEALDKFKNTSLPQKKDKENVSPQEEERPKPTKLR